MRSLGVSCLHRQRRLGLLALFDGALEKSSRKRRRSAGGREDTKVLGDVGIALNLPSNERSRVHTGV